MGVLSAVYHAMRETEMLDSGRILNWTDESDDETFTEVRVALLEYIAQDAAAPIELYINSPGGEAGASFAFYDLVNTVLNPKPHLLAIASGVVASAAIIVLLSVPRERRYMTANAALVLHQGNLSLPGSVYSLTEIVGTARAARWCDKVYVDLIAQHTALSARKIRGMMNRETILSPHKAKKYGFIDHIMVATP